ncbi:AGAP003205-PA [Anopheles gambiae str. PEST]|uniref:AGAP003205-PA n=2 Tax=gambiae species complex TaxID=44542 RepID=Q7PGV2_ANOGA|nr:monocarboxylate transporter 3 [Anopheles coluzzii]XP_049462694.1 monocarboxylate transporter 3 [Anopheles coluzzii]XP_061519621.1 monocarboxylate transporter 3 [Anopheles gambiae]XP_061519622.1 monocarboxylate transporter 3 [Anopheles gambiae]XP_312909.4 monocarboxylate transporter 3 [Anopheles gambiae]EAA44794.4 AGAP003205-PA [Anopheles gambiae str. PEST]
MPPQNSIELTTKPEAENGATGKLLANGNGNGDTEKAKEDPPTTTLIVPPDGGWGWLVMVASFFCNVIVDGIVMNVGSFLGPIRDEFGVSEAEVALVSSLLSGFYLLTGPFVSALANRWGFRIVTIIGSVVAAVGFFVSQYATSIVFLYVTFGFIGGVGFCFIYVPSVITVGYYFEKWRAVATGIALCGSGVGTFIFSPVNAMLIESLGWRSALVAQAAIILLCIACGAIFRPIQPTEVTATKAADTPADKGILLGEGLPVVYTRPLPEGRYAYSMPNSSHNTWMGANPNYQYPTAAEIFRQGSGHNLDRRPSHTSGQLVSHNLQSTTKKLEKIQKRLAGQMTPDDTIHAHGYPTAHHELNPVGEADEEETENGTLLAAPEQQSVTITTAAGRRHTVSGRRPNEPASSRHGSRRTLNDGARPMYRDDIFFTGSLARIPQYKSQTSLGYHMSVTRLPTQADVEETETEQCMVCPEAVRRTLVTMLDMSLLKSISFMMLAFSGFLTMMGFFVPFLYVKQRAVAGGMADEVSTFIVSAIGISNTIARVVCGVLTSFKNINALHLNNVAITLGGIATMMSGMYITEVYQFTYAAIFGLAIACFSALRSILVVDLMGLEKLTNAFGILCLFQGIAAFLGAPIAGYFTELTGTYDASFYISGALITLSAVLCYPLAFVNRWEKQRAAKKDSQKV